MRQRNLYIAGVVIILLLYMVYEYQRPTPLNWMETYSKFHKIPFGTWVLHDAIQSVQPDLRIDHSNKTLFELRDSIRNEENLILFGFNGGWEDIGVLLEKLENGSHVLMSPQYFGTGLLDSLGYSVELTMSDSALLGATMELGFVNPDLVDQKYQYRFFDASAYFEEIDTLNGEVLAINQEGNPVLVKHTIGQGALILTTVPKAFTNYYMVDSLNSQFALNTLSCLPERDYLWSEYYTMGRLESGSPLRFILRQEALKWGYYLLIFSIILFVIFEARRRQRIIPVLEPPRNDTLAFVGTVGDLYLSRRNHKDIAEKRIKYLFYYIRKNYFLATHVMDEEFYDRLTHKTGIQREDINALFKLIISIKNKNYISEEELIGLNSSIDNFYNSASKPQWITKSSKTGSTSRPSAKV